MDSSTRRSNPARSHSISGQDYHPNRSHMQLKQSLCHQQVPHDPYERSPNHLHSNSVFYQHQGQISNAERVSSPIGQQSGPSSLNNRETNNYRSLDRQGRGQMHASLECLNANISEYQLYQHQQFNLQQQYEQQQLNHQHHQYQIHQHRRASSHSQNQHYATGYVLTPPPANTVINQNGEQDLAAAAMGSPPAQYTSSSHSSQTQNLINRAMAHVSQSPLRRLGLNGSSGSGFVSHLNSLNHPMRAGHSTISLASSTYLIEDKLQNEIKKLQEELNTEREKNEALTSQLNINSSLMAAFEQSLTTLNTRLRQLTTLNEKKDSEIEDLRDRLQRFDMDEDHVKDRINTLEDDLTSKHEDDDLDTNCDSDSLNEQNLKKQIDDLKRQLVEKDRLLTDTRLEALSAAHQLEQLESKLSGDHHSLNHHDDDLDEGVMVVNHSPSDSDAVTESHFSEVNNHPGRVQHEVVGERSDSRTPVNNGNANEIGVTTKCQNRFTDSLENYSIQDVVEKGIIQMGRESREELKLKEIDSLSESLSQQFNALDKSPRQSPFMSSIFNSHDTVQGATGLLAGRT